jgi:hypothetical protein
MAFNFRQLIRSLGPRWLTRDSVLNPDGSKTESDSRVLHPIMAMFDAATKRIQLGRQAMMPGLGPEDALAYIGQSMNVLRGPQESRASYESRLQRAIDDHRINGSPWALMSQLYGYCSPHAVRVRIYNNHGNCFTLERDGVTRTIVENTAWNWDGQTGGVAFGRFWVLIYMTTGSPTQPWNRTTQTWGNAQRWQTGKWGGDSGTWGSNATREEVQALRNIVRFWKPTGTRCVSIMLVFNDSALAPSDTAPPLPDGLWTTPKYSGGRQVARRHADAIYFAGSSGTN